MTIDAVAIARAPQPAAPSRPWALPPSDDWRWDNRAERAVIAAVILDVIRGLNEDVWGQVSAILAPRDFYNPKHALAWEVFEALSDRGDPLEPRLIGAELRARNLPNTLTLDELSDIADEVMGTTWCIPHARIVLAHSARRFAVQAAEEFAAMAKTSAPLDGSLAALQLALEDVPLAAEPAPTLADAVIRQSEAMEGKTPAAIFTPTGLASLDASLDGGFCAGHYLLVGHPGVGKTTLAIQWLLHVAQRIGPTYLWSAEQPREECTAIAIANLARVPLPVVRNSAKNPPTPAQLARIAEAMRVLHPLHFHVADDADKGFPKTVAGIVAAVRAANAAHRAKGEPEIAMIVIDNLLELEPRDPKMPYWEGVAANMKALRRARKVLRIPIVTIGHPNGEPTKGALYRRLRQGDVAGGKVVARLADGTLMLHREDIHATRDHKKDPPVPGLMQVYAEKVRPVGRVYAEAMELRSEHRFVSVGVRDELDDFADAGRPSHVRVVDDGEGLPGADAPLPTALEWAAARADDDRGPQDAAAEVA